MAWVSSFWALSCPPLRRERLLLADAERVRRSSSMFDSKQIPTLSAIFLRSHRGPAPVAAGLKRYWGTAMRELNLSKMIEKKVAEAMEVCNGEEGMRSDVCRVAWDEVEEVSSALADLRRRLADSAVDPLEPFCLQNPEAEECRIYEY